MPEAIFLLVSISKIIIRIKIANKPPTSKHITGTKNIGIQKRVPFLTGTPYN